VRWLALACALLAACGASAQEAPKKKKPVAKKEAQAAHKKPTPEQIRRFNELQKKQQ
jgi:outer membrane biogenesis lipoprotein LolB